MGVKEVFNDSRSRDERGNGEREGRKPGGKIGVRQEHHIVDRCRSRKATRFQSRTISGVSRDVIANRPEESRRECRNALHDSKSSDDRARRRLRRDSARARARESTGVGKKERKRKEEKKAARESLRSKRTRAREKERENRRRERDRRALSHDRARCNARAAMHKQRRASRSAPAKVTRVMSRCPLCRTNSATRPKALSSARFDGRGEGGEGGGWRRRRRRHRRVGETRGGGKLTDRPTDRPSERSSRSPAALASRGIRYRETSAGEGPRRLKAGAHKVRVFSRARASEAERVA